MRTEALLLGMIAVTILIAWSLRANAKDIIVDKSGGGDFTTISEAIANAVDGDRIIVRSGVYNENLLVDKNVSIEGENRETTIIEASSNGHTVKLYKLAHCTISNLTIQNAIGTGNDNIYLDECSNVTIRDCTIRDSASSDGISLYRCSHITITNCSILSNKQGNGIFFIFSSHCTVKNNNISKNQVGIFLQYQSSDNTISGNVIRENGYIGVRISASGASAYSPSGNVITENVFIANGQNAEDTTDGLNLWYNPETEKGNYWDDYQGKDANNDGVGDTPYQIPGGNNQDIYVLGFFQGGGASQNKKPIANAGGDYYGEVNEPVCLDASKSYDPDGTIVSYTWDFGDGTSGSGKKVSHTYAAPGDYTVTLTVRDDDGAVDTDTAVVHIHETAVNQKPVPVITMKSHAHVGELVEFNASKSYDPDGSIISYVWRFGDGKADYGKTVYHSYSTSGVYRVELVVVDDDGFSNSTIKNITIYSSSDGAGVKAHLSVEPSTAYVNSIVIFNATGSEGDIETYIWEFGDGNNLTTSSPVCNHTYSKPGTYFVNLTVVGPGGETDNVSEIVVIKESWKKDIPGFGILLTLFLLVIIVIMRRRT